MKNNPPKVSKRVKKRGKTWRSIRGCSHLALPHFTKGIGRQHIWLLYIRICVYIYIITEHLQREEFHVIYIVMEYYFIVYIYEDFIIYMISRALILNFRSYIDIYKKRRVHYIYNDGALFYIHIDVEKNNFIYIYYI